MEDRSSHLFGVGHAHDWSCWMSRAGYACEYRWTTLDALSFLRANFSCTLSFQTICRVD